MFAILKKELKTYFLSPIGYTFIGVFLLMLSIFFYVDIFIYGSVNFEYMFSSGATILTFTVPILTIKLFSEEKKNGTDIKLFTSIKSTSKIVLAKFISAIIVVLILELFTAIYLAILSYFGNPHITTSLLTLFGFLLLSMAYISCGIFISSISKNKIISGILTIVVFIALWFAPAFNNNLMDYSLIYSFNNTFLNGLLSFETITLLVSFTVLFIILTIIRLNKNNYKKINKDIIRITITIALIALFIILNFQIKKINIRPLDLTQEKLYTLSDSSKELVKNVENTVNIYFFGFDEEESVVVLAKQYNKANYRITAEVIDISARPEIAQKYGVESEDVGIIVQSSDKYKVITYQELYTYDYETYEYLDVSEQKLTNAILDVTMKNKPNVYFITGHGEFNINTYGELYNLKMYLQNEINNVDTLNLLTTNFPEDCDLIVISSPKEDYDNKEVEILMDYINNGGNILWLNDSTFIEELPNLSKILEYYGVILGKGVVMENNTSNMLNESPYLILPEISNHKITEDFYTKNNVVFAQATKLTTKTAEELINSNITINKFITSTGTATYFENLEDISSYQVGPFTLGLESIKQINENVSSKLVIYGNNFFITDSQVTIGNSNYSLINLYNNKNLVLNSVAYLTDREEHIVARKDTGSVTVIPTTQEDNIVKLIIFSVPVIIVCVGIFVWRHRRKMK